MSKCSLRVGEPVRASEVTSGAVQQRFSPDKALADELVATLVGPDSGGPSAEGAFCNCGCEEGIPGGGFLPGHDEELRDRLESRVGGLLALSALVRAAESYVHGELTPVELAKDVRGALRKAASRPTYR